MRVKRRGGGQSFFIRSDDNENKRDYSLEVGQASTKVRELEDLMRLRKIVVTQYCGVT